MRRGPEQTLPEVGTFSFEVYGSGRKGRQLASRFTVRCDSIGLYSGEILLVSIAAGCPTASGVSSA